LEEMASRELSLSEFTGTNDRVAVDFSSDNIVIDKPFCVLFSPDFEVVGSLRVGTDVDMITYTSEEER
jgi:hypothetical protein